MIDFYLAYSIIDIIWKIFSILFVLYRFTSFFSTVYNFFNFLGKLSKGLIYIKDQILIYTTYGRKSNNYDFDDTDLPIRPKSFFTIFKEKCQKLYNKTFGQNVSNNIYLPLYETRIEQDDNFESNISIQNKDFNKLNTSLESNDIFNSNQDFSNSYYDINTSSSSISKSIKQERKKVLQYMETDTDTDTEIEELEDTEVDFLFKPSI